MLGLDGSDSPAYLFSGLFHVDSVSYDTTASASAGAFAFVSTAASFPGFSVDDPSFPSISAIILLRASSCSGLSPSSESASSSEALGFSEGTALASASPSTSAPASFQRCRAAGFSEKTTPISSRTCSAFASMISIASAFRISRLGMLRSMKRAASIRIAVRSARRAAPHRVSWGARPGWPRCRPTARRAGTHR